MTELLYCHSPEYRIISKIKKPADIRSGTRAQSSGTKSPVQTEGEKQRSGVAALQMEEGQRRASWELLDLAWG